jgi:glyoxylase-like metal-dependent hydrolase (beta-lactamase superfamily II)
MDAARLDPFAAYQFSVGRHKLKVLSDGTFTVGKDFLAVKAPPQALASALAMAGLAPEGFALPILNLLIETGDQLVLVDTGYGERFRAIRPDAGKLEDGLRANGVAPSDINIVLITHVHPDHAGGSVNSARAPAFPKARYLVSRVDYEFWWDEPSLEGLALPDERKQFLRQVAKETLTALQGQIDQIEPGDEIASGVSILAAPGHTPGHVAVEVISENERLLHISDAAADPVLNLQHPDWFFGPDF